MPNIWPYLALLQESRRTCYSKRFMVNVVWNSYSNKCMPFKLNVSGSLIPFIPRSSDLDIWADFLDFFPLPSLSLEREM